MVGYPESPMFHLRSTNIKDVKQSEKFLNEIVQQVSKIINPNLFYSVSILVSGLLNSYIL